jgi:hypothetical protein
LPVLSANLKKFRRLDWPSLYLSLPKIGLQIIQIKIGGERSFKKEDKEERP